MSKLFPQPITNLPEADIPIDGITGFISQGHDHQIVFMKFTKDFELVEHVNEAQWNVVLEGKIEMVIDGVKKTYVKGDRYFIPKGVIHSGKIYAGYADMCFFSQKIRCNMKQKE